MQCGGAFDGEAKASEGSSLDDLKLDRPGWEGAGSIPPSPPLSLPPACRAGG